MNSRRTFLAGMGAAFAAGNRIRVGLIGPGARGSQLLGNVLKCPDVEVVAFADVFTKRLEDARKRVPTAKTYLDYRHLLEDKSIDAVVIATPQHLHCEHFVASLEAGKHVYQEKTMAFTVDHAKRMRAAWRKVAGKQTVQIGHQDCSSGQVADCKGILEKGVVGKITEIHAHMYRNTPHGRPQWSRPITPDMTQENIIWKSFQGEAAPKPFDPNRYINWRFYWDYSGGNFYENMCHQLAFWYKVLNLQIPVKVSTVGGVFLWKDGREVPDTMDCVMAHPEEMLYTWDSAFGNNQLGITEDLLGTDGTISRGEEILYRPQKVNRQEPAELRGRAVDKGQSHLDLFHMQNFFDCIRSGKEPNCPFDIGFRVSIACRMAVDSYRQEKILRWDPAREVVV